MSRPISRIPVLESPPQPCPEVYLVSLDPVKLTVLTRRLKLTRGIVSVPMRDKARRFPGSDLWSEGQAAMRFTICLEITFLFCRPSWLPLLSAENHPHRHKDQEELSGPPQRLATISCLSVIMRHFWLASKYGAFK